jgi:hypothetical protein
MGSGIDNAGTEVYTMSVINSTLWAVTGERNGNGDSLNYIGVYNGSEWTGVTATMPALGINLNIKALHMANGTTLMYIGGTFTNLRGGMRANYIATFDTVSKAWGHLSVNGAVGVNWEVYAIAAISATEVYIGGRFTATQSGLSVGGIVMWDGTAWTALQDGINNGASVGASAYVMAIAKLGDYVFIGGSFTTLSSGTAAGRLAKWDGTVWSPVTGGNSQGFPNNVQCLLVLSSTLYIGGSFVTAADTSITAVRFAKWTSGGGIQQASLTQQGVGSSAINALTYDGTYIYIGGAFTSTIVGTAASAVTVTNIARFDPVTDQWTAFSVNSQQGTVGSVTALCSTATGVYLGGSFTSTSSSTVLNYVGGWSNANSKWLQLGNPTTPGLDNFVAALYCSSDTLYMGGSFTSTKDNQLLRKFGYISN